MGEPTGHEHHRTHIFVVDDSQETFRTIQSTLAEEPNWKLHHLTSGKAALDGPLPHAPNIVLTDLMLPDMDGLDLVRSYRKKHPLIPVVIMTHQGSDDIAFKALKCGAANYVPKRLLTTELVNTIDSVLAAAEMDRRRQRLLSCLTLSELEFAIGNDPTLIPSIVALLQENLVGMNLTDETSTIRVGIALEEAIVNAMYHGNLEVSSELRREGDLPYRNMIEKRRHEAPYNSRKVFVKSKITQNEATYVIRDEGPGFDPTTLPDPTDPANLESTSGRGLLLIRTFMDSVNHNETGNQIIMVKRRDKNGQNKCK